MLVGLRRSLASVFVTLVAETYDTLCFCRVRGRARPWVSRTAARTLCNFSLRTASGPEGSSAK